MKRSQRLSVALHVLVHLAERTHEPQTSEQLAGCVRTNPVVIRRTLAGLREAGLVRSAAGHGGGWTLAREPAEISVGEVCTALGERLLFAVDLALEKGCSVQGAVSGVLDEFLDDAEALLLARLGEISLADLAGRVHRRGANARVNGGG
jgi:Rrf2 family protein